MRLLPLAAFAVITCPAIAQAQSANPASVAPFALGQGTYTQNFDTLASSGSTGSTLPTGFQIVESGSNANTTYGVGDGSSNAGNGYSFGSTGNSDRALGSLGSGNLSPIMFGGVFTNATGAAITGLTLGYTGEQWRLGNATDDGLTFQYQVGVSGVGGSTGWTTVNALAFAPLFTNGTSTGSAVNGNDAAYRRLVTGSINGLSIASGASFGFRWVDTDSTGSDQGLGVDNLSIAATGGMTGAVPEPASWTMMIAGCGIVGGSLRRRRRTPLVAFA